MINVTVLGSGTSSGVPTIGCTCATCSSEDPHDKRTRTSIWLTKGDESIIIDTSSDFRAQCLLNRIATLDGVIYTHHHFDHIAGFDDLRAFNFTSRRPMPIYLMPETLEHLSRIFSYAFSREKNTENSVPAVTPTSVLDDPFTIGTIEFVPLPLMHGRTRVNGYRIGDFAYCTDCSQITPVARERLAGVRTLILDALRFTTHPTHFSLEQAIGEAGKIGAEQTYLTHIAHDMRHADVEPQLPPGIHLAYDGLQLQIAQ